jgi:hypothetical protein
MQVTPLPFQLQLVNKRKAKPDRVSFHRHIPVLPRQMENNIYETK